MWKCGRLNNSTSLIVTPLLDRKKGLLNEFAPSKLSTYVTVKQYTIHDLTHIIITTVDPHLYQITNRIDSLWEPQEHTVYI